MVCNLSKHLAMKQIIGLLFCCFVLAYCQPKGSDRNPGGQNEDTSENTNEKCNNAKDDDGDGYKDCDDIECVQTSTVTVCRNREDTQGFCHDGADNDGDGKIDCADVDCQSFGCAENTDKTCTDQVDNDEDSYMDCDDFDCLHGCLVTVCGVSERNNIDCQDGIDNDEDGKIDCADYDCRSCASVCQSGIGENTVALCTDGQDNDGDGGIDCRDTECVSLAGVTGCDTGIESTDAFCRDGIDNDNDPWIDCEDLDCAGLADCVENTVEHCNDGEDNDGDQAIDCSDADCEGLAECGENTDEQCSDQLDNDGDNYVDCDDFDCLLGCNVTVCQGTEKSEKQCTDGTDNDGDTFVDCDDFGCKDCAASCQEGGENTYELCKDKEDNDSDGATDCQDFECLEVAEMKDCVNYHDTCCNTHEEDCDDGIDNDRDPWIDCEDLDCRNDPNCAENTVDRCQDTIDNDGDGFVDCDDYDCSLDPVIGPQVCGALDKENTTATCSDTTDNDGDGDIDCADRDCWANPGIEVCPVPIETTIQNIQTGVVGTPGSSGLRIKLFCVTVTSPVLKNAANMYTFFVQEVFPPADIRYRGVEVYVGSIAPTITIGDRVNVLGFYKEFYNLTEIVLGTVTPASPDDCGGEPASGVTAMALLTQDLSDPAVAEPYEGVLLSFDEIRVIKIGVESQGGSQPKYLDFSVLEASALQTLPPLVVSTLYVSATPTVDQQFGYLRGPLTYTWGKYRIAIRSSADLGPGGGSPDDQDGDGLTDAQEILIGTNPVSPDTDDDGVGDLLEVIDVVAPPDEDCDGRIDAIESNSADTDGDGLKDQVDWNDKDGPLADADGDGQVNQVDANDDNDSYCDPHITNVIQGVCTALGDLCPVNADAPQVDIDHDGRGDACDVDLDGDGKCNAGICISVIGQCNNLNDNCTYVSNPTQIDVDNDGVGDACDPDDDNDGICDAEDTAPEICTRPNGQGDNCRYVPNSDQLNHDGDNFGDACDPDDDNDGICDPGVQPIPNGPCDYSGGVPGVYDNCPFDHNPDQIDTDADGIGDACDIVSVPPLIGDVLINEVLFDPPPDISGDANQDGMRDASQDEFIELVNPLALTLDLTGCTIKVKTTVRHTFTPSADPQANLMPPKTGLVIFGGGNPTGAFGDAKVVKASTGALVLSNEGAAISLYCPSGERALQINYMAYTSGNPDQSLTRSVDGSSTAIWVLHKTIPPNAAFSPGTCSNGATFPDCL